MTHLSDNTGSCELQVLPADAAVEAMDDSARAEVVCVPLEELKEAAGEIKADFFKREQKIHRFPASLRPLGERYILPTCVAIGPYHRGLPQVQEMEKVKRAAAYHFTRASGRTLEEMHAAIVDVVDETRILYADDATAGGTSRIFPILASRPSALSATKLEEIGISLTASKTSKLMDIGIKKGHLFGKLFLSPLLLSIESACLLVNMAVFKQCIAPITQEEGEETIVCSYLCLLAMLMDREEDVYELRKKSILQADFTDKETLQFFKSLVKYVDVGASYRQIMIEIEAYRQNRWIRIKLHKFIYNNFKTIVTVLSVIGVLAGIFKTLLSIKQHR